MALNYLSKSRFWLIITVIVGTTLLGGGCGGSDSSEGSAGELTVETGSLSKAKFIQRADAICRAARQKFDRQYGAFVSKVLARGSGEAPGTIDRAVETILLPNYETLIDEVAALGVPSSDEEQVARILGTLQQRLDEIQAQPPELTKTTAPFAKAVAAAESYGLSGCAESLFG